MDASVCTGIRSRNFPMQSRNYYFFGESPPDLAGRDLRTTFEGGCPTLVGYGVRFDEADWMNRWGKNRGETQAIAA
jgi:hypothetical protein